MLPYIAWDLLTKVVHATLLIEIRGIIFVYHIVYPRWLLQIICLQINWVVQLEHEKWCGREDRAPQCFAWKQPDAASCNRLIQGPLCYRLCTPRHGPPHPIGLLVHKPHPWLCTNVLIPFTVLVSGNYLYKETTETYAVAAAYTYAFNGVLRINGMV